MRIPFPGRRALEERVGELEHRESSYTDALVASLIGNAAGKSALPTATAALEASAGLVGRAFATAEVTAPEAFAGQLGPACMAMIGRALIRRGEIVLLIRVDDGGLRLLPVASHDVDGGPDPMTWRYRVTIGGPERTHTYDDVAADGVIHLAYSRDPETPWRGYGPLQVARLAGKLSAETAAALSDESTGPRGSFLPVPKDGADLTIAPLRAAIGKSKGGMELVEAGDWSSVGGATASGIWTTRRFGPEPPAALVELHEIASREVYAACGVPPVLFAGAGAAAGLREAYREFLFATIAPIGRIVQEELTAKLDGDIRLDWTELRASDIASRARAFQGMVGAGMDLARAAALSGLMVGTD